MNIFLHNHINLFCYSHYTILSNRFLNKYLKNHSDIVIFHSMHEALHLAAIQLLILIHLVLQENGKRTVSYSIRTMRNL